MCILNNIGKLTTNTLDTVNSNKTYVYYKMADTTTSESLRMFKLGCCLKVRTHQVRVLPKLVKLQLCHNEHVHVHVILYCHSVDVIVRD